MIYNDFKLTSYIFLYNLIILLRIVCSKHEKGCLKLNVVLFFAKPSCHYPHGMAGIKALAMHEAAEVKFSFPVHHNMEESSDEIMPTPSCKELLKEGLTSLVHFCQNALGMKTAVSSVSNTEITNDINNAEPDVPPEIRERHFSHYVPRNHLQSDIKPVVHQQHLQQEHYVPNPELESLKNVITSPEHTEVFKIRVKREEPELDEEKPGEIIDVPLGKEDKSHPWDVLDIMSHIRFSFFGKLFEDEAKEKISEEENKIAEDLAENHQDPGLFETVKTTLNTLQEPPGEPLLMAIFGGHLSEISDPKSALIQSIKHVIESTDPKTTLIVLTGSCPEHGHSHGHVHEHAFGHNAEHGIGHEHEVEHLHEPEFEHGHVHEHPIAHEPHEPVDEQELIHGHGHGHELEREREMELERERAHELERRRNLKRESEHEESVIQIGEGHHRNATIPVFVRGPECGRLSQCSLLFDVPVVVKSILEEFSPTFEGEGRAKRSIFGDIRMNRENYSNSGDQTDGTENNYCAGYVPRTPLNYIRTIRGSHFILSAALDIDRFRYIIYIDETGLCLEQLTE